MRKYISILASLIPILSISAALGGCSRGPSVAPAAVSGQKSQQSSATQAEPGEMFSVMDIDSPAGAESFLPNLASTSDGRALLSWVEPADAGGHKLRCAIRQGNTWTAASTVYVYQKGELVFTEPSAPSMLALDDGTLIAQWLVKIKDALDPYARNIYVSRSRDGGKTWSSPIIPHRGGKTSDHSFVSLTPMGRGGVGLFWLDGRKMKYTEPDNYDGPTVLMHTTIGPNNELGREVEIDGDVCSCCPTTAVGAARGTIVAYRDHRQEIRDISFTRFLNGRWSEPQSLHDDGWEINGCPVNGPVFSTDGNQIAVIWYTEAKGAPKVKISFSENAGDTFGPPIEVNEGKPAGRGDVLLAGKDGAVVSWVERNEKGFQVLVRRVGANGRRSPTSTVWASEGGKSVGFPHLAKSGDEWLVAWTDATGPKKVRAAAIKMTGE